MSKRLIFTQVIEGDPALANERVEVSLSAESTLEEIKDAFSRFLVGCGFHPNDFFAKANVVWSERPTQAGWYLMRDPKRHTDFVYLNEDLTNLEFWGNFIPGTKFFGPFTFPER